MPVLSNTDKQNKSLISKELIKDQTLEQIEDTLEESIENISKVYEVAKKFALNYNVEEGYETLQKSERKISKQKKL